MKAIRVEQFGGPEVLKLADIPIPKPGVGEVLIRVRAAGVNPVDTYIRSGGYPNKPPLPYTPGSDAAGTIESVGEQVSEFKPGDPVYTLRTQSGSYAEYAVCTTSQVHRLPANITFAQGAALGVPYSTAYRALFQRGQAIHGELVLVHGASGAVGTAAVQLAKSHGLEVWGTAGTERGREHVLQQGATRVFDHGAPGYLDQIAQAANFQGRSGVDVILEMLANRNLEHDLKLLSLHGRVVVIGSRGRVEIDPREAMGREADIRGVMLFHATPRELAVIHTSIFTGLENGSLRPVISLELPLSQAAQSHEGVMQSGALGKIVLIP